MEEYGISNQMRNGQRFRGSESTCRRVQCQISMLLTFYNIVYSTVTVQGYWHSDNENMRM